MSAFLFNIGLVLLAVSASILFCAQAFSLYANSTAIQDIFGNQVRLSLGGAAVNIKAIGELVQGC